MIWVSVIFLNYILFFLCIAAFEIFLLGGSAIEDTTRINTFRPLFV